MYFDPLTSIGVMTLSNGESRTALGHIQSASFAYAEYIVDVESESNAVRIPGGADLRNYPNPFNPRTTIRYVLERPTHARITIHGMAGRLVRTLVDADEPAGWHGVIWDETDGRARPVASGVYLYRLDAGNQVTMRRVAVVR